MQDTSGIPDFYMDLQIPKSGTLAITDVVAALPKSPPMVRAAGEAFEYSNTGYVLLAGILERIYLQPFESLMEQSVFGPAGLQCTRVWNLFSEDEDWPRKTWSMDGTSANAQQCMAWSANVVVALARRTRCGDCTQPHWVRACD